MNVFFYTIGISFSIYYFLGAKVVRIQETTDDGLIDMNDLNAKLEHYKSLSSVQNNQRILIGCFSAASNITGLLNDDIQITAILHSHGALSFWDYATAAPYVEINMNPRGKAFTSWQQYHLQTITTISPARLSS